MSIYGDLLNDDEDETAGGGLPDPVDTVAGPSTNNQAVFDRIQQVRQGTGGDTGSDPSTPSTPFSNSDLAAMDYAHGAQQDASIGRALNAVASGFGAKVDNSGYDAQVNNANTTANKVMDRSARVAQAVAARKLKDQQMTAAKAMFDRRQGAVEAKNKIDADKAAAEIGKAQAETAKLRAETPKSISPGAISPDTDPATLVQSTVPIAKQDEVYKELKRVQNVNDAAPTIIARMKDAIAATQGVGRFTSLLHSPRAIDALHVALAPTFSDLGENARPAIMEQFFHEIDPRPGDTPDDVKTRMAALQEHLKAKSSAPVSKGNGIDLSKFNSTKPYEPEEDRGGGYPKEVRKGTQVATVSSPDEEKEAKAEGFM